MEDSEFLIYQSEDGTTKIEVRIVDETVWLTLNQLAELFVTTKQNINLHIKNILKEGELPEAATVKEYLTVQQEGSRFVKRSLQYYNLDMIISVGYRVNSHRGTQFRIWATQRLREYIIKGFTLDDERLKRAGAMNYFDELLARIRSVQN
ncbi:MAG: virulence RhuM family protein [Saprospiraceae bacterium]|nr:virulence RhuM family protein [Saprospiraceae bacterium]